MKFNFKTSLKLLSVVMAVLMLVGVMAGCGAPKNMSTVLAEGYGKEPLEKALIAFVDAAKENDTTVTYKWENGWNGPDANPDIYLGDKEKAVSLVLTVVSEDKDGDTQTKTVVLYLAYNKKFNVVRECGGYTQSAKEGISTGTYGFVENFYSALEAEENEKESAEDYYDDDDYDYDYDY